MLVPHRKHDASPLRAQQINSIYRFVTMAITIQDIIHRPVFYLEHTMDNVRTS
jgi:hypothetical protein